MAKPSGVESKGPMKGLVDKIREVAGRVADSIGVCLVKVEYIQAGKHSAVKVVIHRESGTGIQDCEKVSRAIEQELDVLDLIPGQYSLEVMSKGIEEGEKENS